MEHALLIMCEAAAIELIFIFFFAWAMIRMNVRQLIYCALKAFAMSQLMVSLGCVIQAFLMKLGMSRSFLSYFLAYARLWPEEHQLRTPYGFPDAKYYEKFISVGSGNNVKWLLYL